MFEIAPKCNPSQISKAYSLCAVYAHHSVVFELYQVAKGEMDTILSH